MKRIEPVHPRMRGERKRRMRILRRAVRFIPACAGNAFPQERLVISNTVHPRMRGERTVAVALWFDLSGSSPHARGTRRYCCSCECIARFIPACAGNASHTDQEEAREAVHPRMRGERAPTELDWPVIHGSSPHARGTRCQPLVSRIRHRFIPACAGNATSSAASRALASVHPRMRGERRLAERCSYTPDGSSPHARGTPSERRSARC